MILFRTLALLLGSLVGTFAALAGIAAIAALFAILAAVAVGIVQGL